jgi:hypothetical protein
MVHLDISFASGATIRSWIDDDEWDEAGMCDLARRWRGASRA